MTDDKISTKEKILQAALEIFVKKGKEGARMQEIADCAGVNKAMLFYYYTSKDLLYAEVFRSNIIEIITNVKSIFISESNPERKLEQIVDAYIHFFNEHPNLPKLIMREIANDGEVIRNMIRGLKQNVAADIPDKFIALIQDSISDSHFHKVDPKQTIISIFGMCIIYFVGKPLIETLLELEDVDNAKFIEQRKQNILFILKNGLLLKE